MAFGDCVHEPGDFAIEFTKTSVETSAFGVCLRRETLSFLMISPNVFGDHTRVPHFGLQPSENRIFYCFQVKSLRVATSPVFVCSRAADPGTPGFVFAIR